MSRRAQYDTERVQAVLAYIKQQPRSRGELLAHFGDPAALYAAWNLRKRGLVTSEVGADGRPRWTAVHGAEFIKRADKPLATGAHLQSAWGRAALAADAGRAKTEGEPT